MSEGWTILAVLATAFGLICWGVSCSEHERDAAAARCELAGGVYAYGHRSKADNYPDLCLRRDTVISAY